MIGGSLLARLPKGFFNWPISMEDGCRGQSHLSVMVVNEDGESRKRRRGKGEISDSAGGSRTPTLVSPARRFSCGNVQGDSEDGNDRPLKRIRGESKIVSVPQPAAITQKKEKQQSSDFLNKVPEDVVAHCLSFLGRAEDRFALQTTCKVFRDISNSDSMLAKVDVGGDLETGKRGIIQEHYSPATAAAALAPFARAGNLESLYM
jgi:hypothetical protein